MQGVEGDYSVVDAECAKGRMMIKLVLPDFLTAVPVESTKKL